jgi:hypothetical protein
MQLRDELLAILGHDLVALWGYGGKTAPDPSTRHGDLDSYAILARAPDEATAKRIGEAEDLVVRAHVLPSDAWYVLADDARRAECPSHAFQQPDEIVPVPTWAELQADLQRELEHLERHVAAGDDDPYEATYAILNGSRILRSAETRDVVISKRSAGVWALEHLPARWHHALRAAGLAYDGEETAEDARRLAAEMAPFVAMVRQSLDNLTP